MSDLRPLVVAALLLLLASVPPARAVNPFVTTAYGADPSGHVFDGRLYVYGSHDRNDAREFDMDDYHVYSTDDLQNWQDHGVVLSLRDVPWAEGHFWAPDCNVKGGIYYFYFPVRPNPTAGLHGRPIGVATSRSPAGPFTDPTPIAGPTGIDPSIFIDDDGTPYLIWAGHGPEIARLKPNMKELDGPSTRVLGCNAFFEGPWLFKRDGTYYLTYPALMPHGSGRGGSGQHYDYATSKTVRGPYAYKGTFTGSRGGGNIHGSQLQFGDQWYCLYHDFSMSEKMAKHGFKRGLRIDLMHFDAAGNILPLEWTTTGPPQLKHLDPYRRCEAECLCQTDVPEGAHPVAVDATGDGGQAIGPLRDGDWVRYAGVDFGPAGTAAGLAARVATPAGGASLLWRLDSTTGPVIATCPVHYTGGWSTWDTARSPVHGAAGVHDLFLTVADVAQGSAVRVDWYQFSHTAPATDPGVQPFKAAP